jgi:hypothetical protein
VKIADSCGGNSNLGVDLDLDKYRGAAAALTPISPGCTLPAPFQLRRAGAGDRDCGDA